MSSGATSAMLSTSTGTTGIKGNCQYPHPEHITTCGDDVKE